MNKSFSKSANMGVSMCGRGVPHAVVAEEPDCDIYSKQVRTPVKLLRSILYYYFRERKEPPYSFLAMN